MGISSAVASRVELDVRIVQAFLFIRVQERAAVLMSPAVVHSCAEAMYASVAPFFKNGPVNCLWPKVMASIGRKDLIADDCIDK